MRSERRWGLIGGAVGSAVGIGSFLIAWLVQGLPWRELSGSPYPTVLRTQAMMPLDYYFLAILVVGGLFLFAALVIARRGRFPRSDVYGSVLTGTILSTLAGIILFVRLWAALHA